MNVSQQLNHINEKNYDDDITVTGLPKGYFIAVTGNNLPAGSSTREISVIVMELQQNPGGSMTTNSGLYVRQANETAVKVTVTQDGNEKATNTTAY